VEVKSLRSQALRLESLKDVEVGESESIARVGLSLFAKEANDNDCVVVEIFMMSALVEARTTMLFVGDVEGEEAGDGKALLLNSFVDVDAVGIGILMDLVCVCISWSSDVSTSDSGSGEGNRCNEDVRDGKEFINVGCCAIKENGDFGVIFAGAPKGSGRISSQDQLHIENPGKTVEGQQAEDGSPKLIVAPRF
jgi:hypothetical protein